jgi:hypothetical protein
LGFLLGSAAVCVISLREFRNVRVDYAAIRDALKRFELEMERDRDARDGCTLLEKEHLPQKTKC